MTARDSTARNIDFVRRYIALIEAGDDGDALRRCYHPEVEQEEFPNAFFPRGMKRDLTGITASFERGRGLLAEQRYEIVNIIASGETVALEFVWTGTLRVDAGPLPAGKTLRTRSTSVIEFRDGLIFRQRSYDCYDPLTAA